MDGPTISDKSTRLYSARSDRRSKRKRASTWPENLGTSLAGVKRLDREDASLRFPRLHLPVTFRPWVCQQQLPSLETRSRGEPSAGVSSPPAGGERRRHERAPQAC